MEIKDEIETLKLELEKEELKYKILRVKSETKALKQALEPQDKSNPVLGQELF